MYIYIHETIDTKYLGLIANLRSNGRYRHRKDIHKQCRQNETYTVGSQEAVFSRRQGLNLEQQRKCSREHVGSWHKAQYPRNCRTDPVGRTGGAAVCLRWDAQPNYYHDISMAPDRRGRRCITYIVKQSHINPSATGLMFTETSSGMGGA